MFSFLIKRQTTWAKLFCSSLWLTADTTGLAQVDLFNSLLIFNPCLVTVNFSCFYFGHDSIKMARELIPERASFWVSFSDCLIVTSYLCIFNETFSIGSTKWTINSTRLLQALPRSVQSSSTIPSLLQNQFYGTRFYHLDNYTGNK